MKRRSFFGLLAAPFVARLPPKGWRSFGWDVALEPSTSVGFLVPEDYEVELLRAIPVSLGVLEDARAFQREEIARLSRIPPSLLEFDLDYDPADRLDLGPPSPPKVDEG